MATALKRIKSIQCLLNLNYLVRSPASWKKPCLGLRFHSDILNSKWRKILKTFFIRTDSCESFKFIYFTGWATKSDCFFSLQYSCNVLFTGYMHLVDSPCSLHDQFWSLVSLFSWQFRIHCMSALLIAFRVTYNWYNSSYYGSKMVLSLLDSPRSYKFSFAC